MSKEIVYYRPWKERIYWFFKDIPEFIEWFIEWFPRRSKWLIKKIWNYFQSIMASIIIYFWR